MRDLGLALIPEFIEWRQPLSDGKFRVFPKVQQRACFTELTPPELPEHARRFGHFALEFDQMTIREMGAVPVFYIPQPGPEAGGSQLGTLLLSVVSDAHALANRLEVVSRVISDPKASRNLNITTSFSMSPETSKKFVIDKNEAKVVFDMLGNALTPWAQIEHGLAYMLNMFYPTDDIDRDRPLDYYRQREWRIGAAFSINGNNIMRSISKIEEAIFAEIDHDFFFRQIRKGFDEARMIDKTIILPAMKGRPFLCLARRILAPQAAIDRVKGLLAEAHVDVEVVAIECL